MKKETRIKAMGIILVVMVVVVVFGAIDLLNGMAILQIDQYFGAGIFLLGLMGFLSSEEKPAKNWFFTLGGLFILLPQKLFWLGAALLVAFVIIGIGVLIKNGLNQDDGGADEGATGSALNAERSS